MWIEPENPGEFDNAIGGKVMDAKGGEVRVVDDDKKVGFLLHTFTSTNVLLPVI